MREAGLVACQPRRARMRTTRADEQAAPIPDLVGRDFTADAPGKVFVGDITYVPTWEGWLYVALVIDCYSRCIAGWAMDDNYKTPLIVEAVTMAARNIPPISNAVFHSDRGSNYTSDEYGSALEDLGLLRSVGRTGICFDCEHRDCATIWGLTLAYDRPCGCPRVDVSAPGGGVHQAAGRVGSDLIGA